MDATLPLTMQAITNIPEGTDRLVLVETPGVFVGVKSFEPGEVFANHFHEGYDEIFMGLEGTITIWQGRNTRVEVGPGSAVTCPRGSHHRLANETDLPVKILFAKVPLIADDTHWVEWAPAPEVSSGSTRG
jgi:quercetin dioxygenase-like cupin family protein